MSWAGWSSRLNVTSIVSQGLEQVSKLKEDVEKQFDQAVQSSSASKPSSATTTVSLSTDAAAATGANGPDLFGSAVMRGDTASASTHPQHNLPPPTPMRTTVDDINVIKSTPWGGGSAAANRLGLQLMQQPPHSADGKQRRTASPPPLPPSPSPQPTLLLTTAPAANGTAGLSDQLDRNKDDSEDSELVVRNSSSSSSNAIVDVDVHTDETAPCEASSAIASSNAIARPTAAATPTDARIDPPTPVDKDASNASLVTPNTRSQLDNNARITVDNDSNDNATAFVQHGNDADSDAVMETDSAHVTLDPSLQPVNGTATHESPLQTERRGSNDEQLDGHTSTELDDDEQDDDVAMDVATVAPPSEAATDALTDSIARSHMDDERVSSAAADTSASVDSTPEQPTNDAALVASLQQRVDAREMQLLTASSTIQELHDELDRTCAREVAAVERTRFLTEQLERMRVEVATLSRFASASVTANQRESEVVALQTALRDKDATLQALLDEGQQLSIKQAALEQRVRQLRKEKNDDDAHRQKLESQFEALVARERDTSAKLLAADDSTRRLQLELQQTQRVAETTAQRLASAEQDAARYKQQTHVLTAQHDALVERCSTLERDLAAALLASQSHAQLANETTALEQTIAGLQQTLHDVEDDAARREERARNEIVDLKRKWQAAVARNDVLGQSITDATQPLLRQIQALESDLHTQQTTARAAEATLLQRMDAIETTRRAIEQQLKQRDAQIDRLTLQLQQMQQDVVEKVAERMEQQAAAAALAAANERALLERLEAVERERDAWQHKCDAHAAKAAEQQQQRRGRSNSTSSSLHTDAFAQGTTVAAELAAAASREAQLQRDLEWHQQELRRLQLPTTTPAAATTLSQQHSSAAIATLALEEDATDADDDIFTNSAAASTVLGLSQLQQRVRLRESENRLVKTQLQALEATQRQLTADVVRLSARNAALEPLEIQATQLQHELQALTQRQRVLLELFGEKEEQVEELQAEVAELKTFYRTQLDTLAQHQHR